MSHERWADLVRPGSCIWLTCKGDPPGTERAGYVGAVSDLTFEFGEVMNSYEHFSNLSADPELRHEHIRFADVVTVTA
jgi:hypothetical protein